MKLLDCDPCHIHGPVLPSLTLPALGIEPRNPGIPGKHSVSYKPIYFKVLHIFYRMYVHLAADVLCICISLTAVYNKGAMRSQGSPYNGFLLIYTNSSPGGPLYSYQL